MSDIPHYPNGGPPIPDGKVVITFFQHPTLASDGLPGVTLNFGTKRPTLEFPFATTTVEEDRYMPYFIAARYWDADGEHWVVQRFLANNVACVTRVCNSAAYGKALQEWELLDPDNNWQQWLPSVKRPPGSEVT